MKHPATKSHNYMRRVEALANRIRETTSVPLAVMEVIVSHDDWCDALKPVPRFCNCSPRVSGYVLEGTHPQRSRRVH